MDEQNRKYLAEAMEQTIARSVRTNVQPPIMPADFRVTGPDPSRAEMAMAAMQGMLFGCVGNIGTSTEVSAYAKGHCNSAIAERAVAMADALIAALEKAR
jgi:hypothetical protein